MANILDDIPADLPQELFDELVATGAVTIERIVSRGHASPAAGWYDQDRHEWVLLAQGAAILLFKDGERLSLGPGDHVTIPAHRKHRVEWTSPDQDTVWVAVFYGRNDS